MIKRFIAGLCLLFSVSALAQQSSYSPYSFYGLGEQRFKGTAEFRSMGGLSFMADSIHINLQNPAGYSALKLTTFAAGGSTSRVNLSTETASTSASRTVLDYLAVAFPINKGGISFGLMPYTSTGYRLFSAGTLDTGETTQYYHEGKGGLNRVYLGGGYEITKNFRVGLDVNYNFGRVETESRFGVAGVQYGTREVNYSEMNGFSMTAGLMYEGKISKDLKLYAGASYVPETKMNVSNERYLSIVSLSGLDYTTIEQDTLRASVNDVRMPSRFSLGAGLGKPQKWNAGAEVTLQNTAGQQSRYGNMSNVGFENSVRYAVGGYYIPNYMSFTSYLARVTYRFGARYEKTGLVVNNKSITDAAGTFGLGFPMPGGGTFSNINLGLEYGKRGTVYSGLVEENYFNVSIGLSFNDRWFMRRKYD